MDKGYWKHPRLRPSQERGWVMLCFLSSAVFFPKIYFLKKKNNSGRPPEYFVGPESDTNCLQMLSAAKKQLVKERQIKQCSINPYYAEHDIFHFENGVDSDQLVDQDPHCFPLGL